MYASTARRGPTGRTGPKGTNGNARVDVLLAGVNGTNGTNGPNAKKGQEYKVRVRSPSDFWTCTRIYYATEAIDEQ